MTTVSEEELHRLNAYTRRRLSAEEVFVFSVTLCDNEVDRDFERFSIPALHQLAALFLGKSGIFDHDRSAGGQTARIFETWVEEDAERTTSQGEVYTMLRAKAYMVRTEENRSLIEEIDGGIKKEVSVGCSMKKATCSICGASHRSLDCEHRPGTQYGERLCHLILDEPLDAYEWSFVAVPAQREAGVTKAFFKTPRQDGGVAARIMHAAKGVQLSAEEVQSLKRKLAALETAQSEQQLFRGRLLHEIEGAVLRALPRVDCKAFLAACSAMDTPTLQTLETTLKAQAAADLPPVLQLKSAEKKTGEPNNRAFRI